MPTIPLLVSSLGTGDAKTKEGIAAVVRKENHALGVKQNLAERIIQTRSLNFEFAALIKVVLVREVKRILSRTGIPGGSVYIYGP